MPTKYVRKTNRSVRSPADVLERTAKQVSDEGRDGFRERGALRHLSFWGPTQVRPIWPFVWKYMKVSPLMGSAPTTIHLLWFRLWFWDCLKSSTEK